MVKIRSNICIFEKKVVSLRDFINYMRNRLKIQYFFWCIMLLLFSACNVTKFVPQGEYLLNDVKVKVEGTKDVSSSDLMKYIQQKQNTEILGFWKLQLGIYNTAPLDSTKRTSKMARRVGEAPVVFSSEMAAMSMNQLRRAMENKGYYGTRVDTSMVVKDGKVNLSYHVTAGTLYLINDYKVNLDHPDLRAIASSSRDGLLKKGETFDVDLLTQERQRVASAMRRRGYYFFNEDCLVFNVDSALSSHSVNIEMCLHNKVLEMSDIQRTQLFRQYKVNKVYISNYEKDDIPQGEEMFSNSKDGYVFNWAGEAFLRDNVLIRNCLIKPGSVYSEQAVERTYARLKGLAPVKYVDIFFELVEDSTLDCNVVVSRSKLNSVSTELEGTYSAGDWGIAAGLGYANYNLFRGAEEFSVNARASYEWRQNGGRAIEAKASTQLRFSSDVSVDVGYHFQHRPDEYTRSIFNGGLRYQFSQHRSRLNHQFRFLDISYVYLPWISDAFRDQFLQPTNILKYSYENHLIVGLGYSGRYTTYRSRQPHRSYVSMYYNVETAGNMLRMLARPCGFDVDEESGSYTLLKTPFSQYAKADFSVTYNHTINPRHKLVWHADLGLAVPYGNSQTIPFEKRYFAGGSNSVRGWAARTLGPGGYKGSGDWIDFNNQSGDVRLNLNMEYRAKVWSIIELAAFFDAGNIWTVYDYTAQPYGAFKWNEFYKQIAMSYGLGVRLDLTFFVLRVDMGVKFYDPSRLYDNSRTQWRTVSNGLNWKDDFVFHIAIGHPF